MFYYLSSVLEIFLFYCLGIFKILQPMGSEGKLPKKSTKPCCPIKIEAAEKKFETTFLQQLPAEICLFLYKSD
jgi:hypothetical protein